MSELMNQSRESMDQEPKVSIDPLAETAMHTEKKDSLSVFVNNLKIYCALLIEKTQDKLELSKYKFMLQNQISDLWLEEPLKDLRILIENPKNNLNGYPLFKNLSNFEEFCRELMKMKTQAENEEAFDRANMIMEGFFKEIEEILSDSQQTVERFNKYDLYGNSKMEQSISVEKEKHQVLAGHYDRELINTKIDFAASVFTWVKPALHKVYISESAKAYNEIAPIRIKTIIPNSPDSPVINIKNYFKEGLEDNKAFLAYCIPGTKNVGHYLMNDICKLLSMESEYYHERTLSNDWTFSRWTRSLTTPEGKIFAINCKTTQGKIDSCMYQIGDLKASNRGPLPNPKRQSSFIYLNGFLYVIGGYGDAQKCSNKGYRYNLKEKKWSNIAQSNVALKKPTLCTLNNRYLLKIGGLNEFDYISKVIEIYDPLTDKWSLVRAMPKNILEQIEILEDSLAVQINDDQVYVFGGKNSNKYSSDKGLVLQINEIRERRKGAAKVNGELWNVNVGKRNLLSFSGAYSPANVVVHFNCVYFLRVKFDQALSI